MSRRIFVGNLSYGTSDQGLRETFGAFGTVTDAKVITDRETGRSRGFGFVQFAADSEAQAAIEGMNGNDLDGRQIAVNIAEERRPGGGGGGRPNGGGGYRSEGGPRSSAGGGGGYPEGHSFRSESGGGGRRKNAGKKRRRSDDYGGYD